MLTMYLPIKSLTKKASFSYPSRQQLSVHFHHGVQLSLPTLSEQFHFPGDKHVSGRAARQKDADEPADGKKFFGHQVQSCEALAQDGCCYVLVTYTEDIQSHKDRLISAGVKPDCILNLRDYAKG